MKELYKYIKEEGVAATPGNTMGVGNPMPAGVNGNEGSEPIPTAKAKKQKKKKTLKESLLDDEEELVNNDNGILIKEFLDKNYKIDGNYSIDGNIVNAPNARVQFINNSNNIHELTNGLFEFGDVRSFICRRTSITSLKGGPKKVDFFSCGFCQELKSLEGAPQIIDGEFTCESCKKLTSLKGLPNIVNGHLECTHCHSLKSLRGAPKKINGTFDIIDCKKLKNLNYLPEVMGNFYCEEDIMNANMDIIERQVKGDIRNRYGTDYTDY